MEPMSGKNLFHVMAKPIGSKCNLDCKYCFYLEKEVLWQSGERFRMSGQTLETFVKTYIESQDVDTVTFAWQGGEPMLAGLEFYRKAIELQQRYANGKLITNTIQTNGTLIDESWARFLKEHGFLVGVSIDGPKQLHDVYRVGKKGTGSWNEVMRGIEHLRAFAVDWNSLTCVHRANAGKALEVYRFLKGIGSRYMQFIPIVERKPDADARSMGLTHATPIKLRQNGEESDAPGPVRSWSVKPGEYGEFLLAMFDRWARKDVGKVFVQMHEYTLMKWIDLNVPGLCVFEETCGNALALEHDGSLYACDHYVYPDYRLGNVVQSGIDALACGDAQRSFGTDKRDLLPRQCIECPVKSLCNGGCPKHRFLKDRYGNQGLNYLCEGYLSFFTKTAPVMREMARLHREGKAPSDIMNLLSSAG
jgi:uncharacterized protein